MSLRVLHWYPSFLDGGGVANAVLGLAVAESRQGSHVVIAAASTSRRALYDPMDSVPGVEVLVWHPWRSLRIGSQMLRPIPSRELMKLRDMKPDIVHVHGEFNLENLRLARLFRCPLVISPHGAFHPVVLAKSRRIAKRIYLAFERVLLKHHVRAFHALAPAEAEHIAALYPEVARYCVPNGASVPVRGKPRRDGIFTFLFVGRLDVFTKGLDVLVAAFRRAVELSPCRAMRLILAGPDWKGGRAWLEQQVSDRQITDRVTFTGPLTGEAVGAVLAGADVYVQLSRHDGFPLSVVEALLASKPLILTSGVGTISYPEIAALPHIKIVPARTEDAALAMKAAAENVAALRTAALARQQLVTEFFSWARIARLHLNQYRQLLHVAGS